MNFVKIVEGGLGLLLISSAAVGDEPGALIGAVLLADAFGVKI